MVEQIPGLPENVVGFAAKGKITREDYPSVITPAVEAVFARHSKARLLYHLGKDFTGIKPAALWEDAKMDLKHLKGWEKFALVSEVEWIRLAVKILELVIPWHVHVFHNRELADAKRWVSE